MLMPGIVACRAMRIISSVSPEARRRIFRVTDLGCLAVGAEANPMAPGEPGVAAARRREGLFDLKPTRLSRRGGNGLPRGGGV